MPALITAEHRVFTCAPAENVAVQSPSSAGDRVWELTGGILRCAECGRAMSVNYIRAKGRGYGSRLSRLKDLERSKDALVSHYASLVPAGLDELSPTDKNKVYEMMRLRVFAHPDGTLIAAWGCNVSPLPPGSSRTRDR